MEQGLDLAGHEDQQGPVAVQQLPVVAVVEPVGVPEVGPVAVPVGEVVVQGVPVQLVEFVAGEQGEDL